MKYQNCCLNAQYTRHTHRSGPLGRISLTSTAPRPPSPSRACSRNCARTHSLTTTPAAQIPLETYSAATSHRLNGRRTRRISDGDDHSACRPVTANTGATRSTRTRTRALPTPAPRYRGGRVDRGSPTAHACTPYACPAMIAARVCDYRRLSLIIAASSSAHALRPCR